MANQKVKIKIQNYCISLLILLLAVPAWAGVGSSSGFEFLKLGGGSRPLAVGQAYAGLADDVSSIYYNPAGLAQVEFQEMSTMSNSWFAGMSQVLADAAFPTRFGTMAVGYTSLSSGDIQGYGPSGEVTSIFNTASSAINLSFGRKVSRDLSLGLGVKSISERLQNVTAQTAAFDLGLQYRVNPNLVVGAAAMNLGGPVKFVSDQTSLPTSYRAGGAYATHLMGENINLAADAVSYAEGTEFDLGLEYLIRDMFAFRVGSDAGALRAGLGITTNILAIDYAYRGHTDLGATHQVSLSLLFGAPERSKKLVLENLAYGRAYMKENKFSEAIVSLDKALDIDPQNEEANLLVKKALNELDNQALEKVFAQKEVEVQRSVSDIIASGKQFLDQGKYIEALGEFGNALKLDPTNGEVLRLQSQAQFKMESQLIGKSQAEAKEYLGEAMKLVITGKYSDAIDPLNKALEKDPKNKQALELKKKLELIQKIQKK